MSRYFINFTEEIGEMYVKPATDEAVDERYSSHGKLYRNPKRNTYMIDYYGVKHKAKQIGPCAFIFSHKRQEYLSKLEEDSTIL